MEKKPEWRLGLGSHDAVKSSNDASKSSNDAGKSYNDAAKSSHDAAKISDALQKLSWRCKSTPDAWNPVPSGFHVWLSVLLKFLYTYDDKKNIHLNQRSFS